MAPAGASNARLAQLAYEAKEAWKEVLRDYYQWQKLGDEVIKQGLFVKVQLAKQKALNVLNDQDFLSIAQDFDQAITSARVTQADKERFIQLMVPEWVSASVPEEIIAEWKQEVRESDPETGRRAILESGGFAAYVSTIITRFNLGAEFQEQAVTLHNGRFRMQPLLLCEISGITCIVSIGALIYLHLTTDEGENKDEKGGLAMLAATACNLAASSCKSKKKEQPPPPPGSGS